MAGASAVITNFFHGCVFALLNGKPWASAPSDYRSIKIPDLAAKLGTEHRIVNEETSDADLAELLGTPVLPQVRHGRRTSRPVGGIPRCSPFLTLAATPPTGWSARRTWSGPAFASAAAAARAPTRGPRWRGTGDGFLKPIGPADWYSQPSEVFSAQCPFSPAAANEDVIAAERFPDAPLAHGRLGRFEAAYVGYAAEPGFRANGSSGGMTSWLATELLRSGRVDAVAHVSAADPDLRGGFFEYRVSRSPASSSRRQVTLLSDRAFRCASRNPRDARALRGRRHPVLHQGDPPAARDRPCRARADDPHPRPVLRPYEKRGDGRELRLAARKEIRQVQALDYRIKDEAARPTGIEHTSSSTTAAPPSRTGGILPMATGARDSFRTRPATGATTWLRKPPTSRSATPGSSPIRPTAAAPTS